MLTKNVAIQNLDRDCIPVVCDTYQCVPKELAMLFRRVEKGNDELRRSFGTRVTTKFPAERFKKIAIETKIESTTRQVRV